MVNLCAKMEIGMTGVFNLSRVNHLGADSFELLIVSAITRIAIKYDRIHRDPLDVLPVTIQPLTRFINRGVGFSGVEQDIHLGPDTQSCALLQQRTRSLEIKLGIAALR